MSKLSFLLAAGIAASTMATPALAQDTTITYSVERTIEPTDGGGGTEVTFHLEATVTRDLAAKGQQGYDIEAVRTQTVTGKDGDRVIIRQEIDGRGAREITVEREVAERTEKVDTTEKPARPDRPG